MSSLPQKLHAILEKLAVLNKSFEGLEQKSSKLSQQHLDLMDKLKDSEKELMLQFIQLEQAVDKKKKTLSGDISSKYMSKLSEAEKRKIIN